MRGSTPRPGTHNHLTHQLLERIIDNSPHLHTTDGDGALPRVGGDRPADTAALAATSWRPALGSQDDSQ